MKIKELGHLAFKCQDLKKSETFYSEVLGFKRQFALCYGDRADAPADIPADREWIVYMKVTDGLFLELFDPEGAKELSVPEWDKFNYQHLALIVEDIHEARDELAKHGVPIDTEPELGIDNTWQMWSHDPDGNKIEFMQYTDKSYQVVGR